MEAGNVTNNSEVSEEMIDEQMDNISGVLDGVESIRESIESLEAELDEIYEEIESLTRVIFNQCVDWAEEIKQSNNSVFMGFFKIYNNNVNTISVFLEIQEEKANILDSLKIK